MSGVGTEEKPEAAKGKWSCNSGKHPLSNRRSEYIDRLRKIYDLNLPNYKDPGVSGPPPLESRLRVQDPSSFCHQDHIVYSPLDAAQDLHTPREPGCM